MIPQSLMPRYVACVSDFLCKFHPVLQPRWLQLLSTVLIEGQPPPVSEYLNLPFLSDIPHLNFNAIPVCYACREMQASQLQDAIQQYEASHFAK